MIQVRVGLGRLFPLAKMALLTALGATVVSGCNCGKDEPAKVPSVTLTSPAADNLTIRVQDDEDLAQAGIQYTVNATASNIADSSTATLLLDDVEVSGSAQTVGSGEVAFSKVTFAAGSHTVAVQVKDAKTGKTVSATRTVIVEQIATCGFVTPINGSTLHASDDVALGTPGVQVDVKVDCPSLAANTKVTLTVLAPLGYGGAAQLPIAGTYAADGASFPAVTLAEGANVLQFEVVGGAKVAEQVTLDTGGCGVWITDANDAIYNAGGEKPEGMSNAVVKDLDTSTPGIQAKVSAKADIAKCPAGSSAALLVNGTSLATATVGADGTMTFNATLPDGDPVKAQVAVTLAGKSEAAATSLANTYHVDAVVPQLELLAPIGTLFPADDQEPTKLYMQTAAVIHFTAGIDAATQVSILEGTTQLLAPQRSLVPDSNNRVVLLPYLDLTGGEHQLVARAQRRLGNLGLSPVVSATAKIVTLEIQAPRPDLKVCNAAADEDPSTPDICDLTLSVKVTPADAKVQFTLTGLMGTVTGAPTPAVVDPVGGIASGHYKLPQSSTLLTLTVSAADGTPNATEEIQLTVDTVPPTIQITSPVQGAPPITDQSGTVVVLVSGVELQQLIDVTSTLVPTKIGSQAKDSPDTVSIGVSLPVGSQRLTATVSDAAGNTASASVDVVVDVSGCDVGRDNPTAGTIVFYTGNTTGGHYQITGHSTKCPLGKANLTKTVGGASTVLGSADLDASGNFSFDFAPVDGEADATLNIMVVKEGQPSNAGVNLGYTADFTPPTLDSITPALGSLIIVNAGNPNVGKPGYLADADANAADGQVALTLTATGVGTISSSGQGSISIDSVTPAFSQAYSDNRQITVPQTTLTLAEGFSGTVTITLKDAAGNTNTTTAQWNATVGTIAVPKPTVTRPTAGTINIFGDIGGDRASFAVVQSVVTYASAVGNGIQVVMCTNLQASGATPCRTGGFFEIQDTRQTASGVSQLFPLLHLGQNAQQIIAELTDALGFVSASSAVNLVVDTVPPVVTLLSADEDAPPKDGVLSGAELQPDQSAHFTAAFGGVENGQIASLFEGTAKLAEAVVSGGSAAFTIASPSEGQHTYRVAVSDAAGNPNESTAVSPVLSNPSALLLLKVQRVAPSISVAEPTFTVCNQALNKVPSASICTLDFTVLVGATATAVDFGGPGSPSPATVATSSGATAIYTLGQGGPFTLVATVRDAAGNTREASAVVSVDTVPPSISFGAPAQNEIFTTQLVPVSVSTDAEIGQVVTVTTSTTGNIVGQGAVVAGGTANFDVNVPVGSQTLSATVSDAAGNLSSQATVPIQVNILGCDVNLTSPAGSDVVFNAATAPGGLVHIAGNTTALGCRGRTVTFFARVGAVEFQVGTATADSGTGAFAFDHVFGNGTVTVFSAEITLGAITNRSSFTATTDYTPPSLTINAPTPNASNQLFVVATGNVNVQNNVLGYVADATSAPGGQVNFNLTIGGGGSSTGPGSGSLVINQGSTNKLTQPIASNATVNLNPLALVFDQAFSGPLTLTVTDAAGNTASATWQLTVDVVSPNTPPAITTDPGNGVYTRVVHARHADADLVLQTPSDDGPAGQTLTWEFGYSTATRLGSAQFDDEAFANPAVTTKLAATPAGPTGSAATAQFRAIPALDTLHLGARILDAVGNVSALATATLQPWTDQDVDYPGATSTPTIPVRFGQSLAGGVDINGDTIPDFAASAPSENNRLGAVYVYLGGASAMPSQLVRLAGLGANGQFGFYMAMGDINGDGHADLAIYERGDTDIFLATNSSGQWTFNATPDFKIHSSTGSLSSMTIIPDINGDGISELAIGEPNYSSSLGRVYLFFGRSSTDWSTLVSAGIVSAGSANVSIVGGDAGGKLGSGGALNGLRPFLGDSRGALSIAALVAKKVYLFSGATLLSGSSLTTASALGPFSSSAGNTFGDSSSIGDVNGDGLDDFLVGDGGQGYVFAYLQLPSHTFNVDPGAAPWASGANFFGSKMLYQDINADGRADIVVGGNTTNPGFASLFWSAPIGLAASTKTTIQGGNGFANFVLALDATGDSLIDLISATPSGGPNGNGRITIRR